MREELPARPLLGRLASRSCGGEGDVQEFAAGLVVLETIGDHAQRERLHVRDRLVLRRAPGKYPRKLKTAVPSDVGGMILLVSADERAGQLIQLLRGGGSRIEPNAAEVSGCSLESGSRNEEPARSRLLLRQLGDRLDDRNRFRPEVRSASGRYSRSGG